MEHATHQAVHKAQRGLAKGGDDGVGNPVAQAGLDETASQEVGDGDEPSGVRRRTSTRQRLRGKRQSLNTKVRSDRIDGSAQALTGSRWRMR